MDTQTSPKKSPILLIVLVVVVVGILGSALNKLVWQKTAEKTAEKYIEKSIGGNANVDINNDGTSFEIKTEEGNMVVNQEGKLPSDFPSDVKMYGDAKVTGYLKMDSEDANGYNVTFTSNKSVDEVSNFYKESLVKEGWKITADMSTETYRSLAAEKDNRNLVISLAVEDEEVTGVISLQQE